MGSTSEGPSENNKDSGGEGVEYARITVSFIVSKEVGQVTDIDNPQDAGKGSEAVFKANIVMSKDSGQGQDYFSYGGKHTTEDGKAKNAQVSLEIGEYNEGVGYENPADFNDDGWSSDEETRIDMFSVKVSINTSSSKTVGGAISAGAVSTSAEDTKEVSQSKSATLYFEVSQNKRGGITVRVIPEISEGRMAEGKTGVFYMQTGTYYIDHSTHIKQ